MRDAHIVAMQQANGRRSMLLFDQFEFLKTRQEAYDTVLSLSRLRDRIRWFLNPEYFIGAVNNVQQILLQEAAKKAAAAAAKANLSLPS